MKPESEIKRYSSIATLFFFEWDQQLLTQASPLHILITVNVQLTRVPEFSTHNYKLDTLVFFVVLQLQPSDGLGFDEKYLPLQMPRVTCPNPIL